MGLFSSSSSSSKNYSTVDNSYTETHTYTDAGAIEAGAGIAETALSLAEFSLQTVGEREKQALDFAAGVSENMADYSVLSLSRVADYSENALAKVADSYQESDAQTMQTIIKWGSGALMVAALAWALKGAK